MGCVKSASLLFSVLSPFVLIGVAHGAETPGDEAGGKAGDEAGDEAEGIAQDEDRAPAGEAEDDRVAKGGAKPESSPWVEEENQDYRFVGLRARMAYIPEWMFGLFGADGGKGVVVPSFGPEYVTRRDGFEVDTWLTFASYGMGDTPFKASSDPDTSYEIVRSEIKTLTVGADFLWTKPLNDKGLSLTYGMGAGIGVVFGSLYRNQSYPPNGQPGDPEDYVKCPGPGGAHGDYCDNENDHYGDFTESSWINGGAKPVLFPWVAVPQVGLRWKASRQLVLRLDTGLSFPGPFFLGVSGQYGLL
jgi:hypothetical protein